MNIRGKGDTTNSLRVRLRERVRVRVRVRARVRVRVRARACVRARVQHVCAYTHESLQNTTNPTNPH